MIDGIKITCHGTNPQDWIKSDSLDFALPVSAKTGEILRRTMHSKNRSLVFSISPDYMQLEKFGRCHIRGSLHKFWDKSQSNNNDFTFANIAKTLQKMSKEYFIDMNKATIHGLEFGVNIQLKEFSAKDFLDSIVSLSPNCGGAWLDNSEKRVKVFSRTEYDLKIYDKGLQTDKANKGLLRVEIRVKKMRYLEKYGINNLTDLNNRKKVFNLGQLLLNITEKLIVQNNSIDKSKLSRKEKRLFTQYTNADFWKKCDSSNRYYHKQVFNKILSKNQKTDLLTCVLFAVKKKWIELVQKENFGKEIALIKNKKKVGDIDKNLTFKIKGEFKDEILPPLFFKNEVKEEKNSDSAKTDKTAYDLRTFCMICKRDISEQQRGSKVCSPKHYPKQGRTCEKKMFILARKAKEKQAREREQSTVKEFTKILKGAAAAKAAHWSVAWQTKGNEKEAVRRLPLSSVSLETVGKIQKVVFVSVDAENGKEYAVSKQRAKNMMREIWKHNESQSKKSKSKK